MQFSVALHSDGQRDAVGGINVSHQSSAFSTDALSFRTEGRLAELHKPM
jgi:hypothetical protein